jgi:hypothetical protein
MAEISSMGVWIFSGTTHCTFMHHTLLFWMVYASVGSGNNKKAVDWEGAILLPENIDNPEVFWIVYAEKYKQNFNVSSKARLFYLLVYGFDLKKTGRKKILKDTLRTKFNNLY